jgi:enoyl-CoA hydratase/carnithine racemase
MSDVLVERRGAVQWIIINRPERRNALNEQVIKAIDAGIAQAVDDRQARAIVLTGAGEQAFCAGADLQKNVQGGAFEIDFSRPRHYIVELFKRIQQCTLPIVARVNGHAMAGGFGLLCACDMAVAADDIRVGTPESRLGMTPMMILPFMQRVLPPRRLQEICVTCEQFDAADGLAMGLFNYVVPRAELDTKLEWLLRRITDKSPTAVRIGKQTFNAIRDMGLREALEYAQAMLPVMSSTEDAREGKLSFQEKRPPVWSGK